MTLTHVSRWDDRALDGAAPGVERRLVWAWSGAWTWAWEWTNFRDRRTYSSCAIESIQATSLDCVLSEKEPRRAVADGRFNIDKE